MLLPILAPFFRRAMTAEVFLQPTARSRGRIPLQSTCSTDAPWSTRYCTWTRIKATFFTTFINSLHYIALCSGCRTGRTGNCSKLTQTQSWLLWLYTPHLGLRRMQPDPEVCVHCGLHELWLLLSPQALWPMRAGLLDTPSSVPWALLCRSVRGRLLETDRFIRVGAIVRVRVIRMGALRKTL